MGRRRRWFEGCSHQRRRWPCPVRKMWIAFALALPVDEWTKFKKGLWFPVPAGAMWDRRIIRYEPDSKGNMSAKATSEVQQNSSVSMAAQSRRIDALVRETHELLKAGVTDVKEYERICMCT